jgi:hypothetical protein
VLRLAPRLESVQRTIAVTSIKPLVKASAKTWRIIGHENGAGKQIIPGIPSQRFIYPTVATDKVM